VDHAGALQASTKSPLLKTSPPSYIFLLISLLFFVARVEFFFPFDAGQVSAADNSKFLGPRAGASLSLTSVFRYFRKSRRIFPLMMNPNSAMSLRYSPSYSRKWPPSNFTIVHVLLS